MSSKPLKNKGKVKVSEGTIEKANWDHKNHSIFVKLCAAEVLKGNRPQTHLNPKGWANVEKALEEATKRTWAHGQLKNRWDTLKREWSTWQSLVSKETGLGIDHVKGTIDASDEWWEEKIKVRPDYAKFRERGLAHVDQLEIMYRDAVATGEHAWAPSSHMIPDEVEDETLDLENEEIERGDRESNASEDTGKRSSSEVMGTSSQRKRAKRVSAASKLEKSINRIVDAIESSNKSKVEIEDVLNILAKLPDITEGCPLYLFATTLFMKSSAREMFVKLPSNVRLGWLQHQYDLAKGIIRA